MSATNLMISAVVVLSMVGGIAVLPWTERARRETHAGYAALWQAVVGWWHTPAAAPLVPERDVRPPLPATVWAAPRPTRHAA